ncbi:hypothetical protein ACVIHF_008584 [Bradyrhizobium sp. USDA 4506]
MENVRRYRAIASLCRQTAAFRPIQGCSLLAQAAEWEERAVAELERHFTSSRGACLMDSLGSQKSHNDGAPDTSRTYFAF